MENDKPRCKKCNSTNIYTTKKGRVCKICGYVELEGGQNEDKKNK